MNESIRSVLRKHSLLETDLEKMSKQELEDALQQYLDVIGIKKSKGESIPQGWIDRMGKVQALLNRETGEEGTYSIPVFGHPQATSFSKYVHLVPIKVRNSSEVRRFMDRAQKEFDILAKKIGKAEAIAKGSIRSTPSQVKKAKQYLSSMEHTEDETFRDLIRDETLPELIRLLKVLK